MPSNKNGGSLAVLEVEVRSISQSVKKHDHAIFGNGSPGLIQTVARLEAVVNGLAQTISKVEDSSHRMEMSAARMESHTAGMVKGLITVKRRVAEVESMIKPIVDWKKGIIIRITTVLATAGGILGVLWAAFENWDKIKGLFQ